MPRMSSCLSKACTCSSSSWKCCYYISPGKLLCANPALGCHMPWLVWASVLVLRSWRRYYTSPGKLLCGNPNGMLRMPSSAWARCALVLQALKVPLLHISWWAIFGIPRDIWTRMRRLSCIDIPCFKRRFFLISESANTVQIWSQRSTKPFIGIVHRERYFVFFFSASRRRFHGLLLARE